MSTTTKAVTTTIALSAILAGGLGPLHPATARPGGEARSVHSSSERTAASQRWVKLGRTTTNFSQPALVSGLPGQDWDSHILWARATAGDASQADLVHTLVTASGDVSTTNEVVTGWNSIWPVPDLVVYGAYASLMAIWGGTRTLDPNETNSNISVAWQPPDGTASPWELQAGDVSEGQGGGSSSIGATVPAGQEVLFTWYGTTGVFTHRGLDPSTPDYNLQTQLGGCCGYSPDIVSAYDAATLVAWYSSAAGHQGVWLQQIEPASGAPIGSAVRMPGSTTRFNGQEQSLQQITRTPIAARPGSQPIGSVYDPNTYVAYPGGYPAATKMLVWRITPQGPATSSVVVGRGRTVHTPAITTDAGGHAWVLWSEGGTGDTRLFARRSNVGGTRWGATVAVRLPADSSGCQTLYEVTPESPIDDDVDIVATLSDGCDASVALWHTDVEPGLSLSADPSTFTGKQRVRFIVDDAGDPVRGAKVAVGGKSDTTNAEGVATIVLGPYARDKKLVATVTHSGYVGDKVTIRAHD